MDLALICHAAEQQRGRGVPRSCRTNPFKPLLMNQGQRCRQIETARCGAQDPPGNLAGTTCPQITTCSRSQTVCCSRNPATTATRQNHRVLIWLAQIQVSGADDARAAGNKPHWKSRSSASSSGGGTTNAVETSGFWLAVRVVTLMVTARKLSLIHI